MHSLAVTTAEATFSRIDWLIVLVYFILVVGVGVWSSRSQKTKRDFFLGGRQLPWWVVGLSIIATETSALTFIGIPAIAFGALSIDAEGNFSASGGNMFFIQLIIGYVIGRIIIAFMIIPYYFTGDVYTPFQLLKRAFGIQTRYTAAGLSLVGLALGAGVRVLVTAIPITIVMQTVYEGFTIWMSILLIMVVALIYTAIGGIKAVVWTDMLQYFIFITGGLFTVLYIPTLLEGDLAAPSGATSWEAIREVASENMRWWNTGFVSSAEAAERLGEDRTFLQWLWLQISNVFTGPFNIVMGIVPQTIGILLAFGFDQLNVQRILGCRNEKEGRNAMLLSAFLIFPQFVLFLLIGVCLYAFYTIGGYDFGGIMPWDPNTVNPETGHGSPKGDFVFPIFIVTHVPPIAKGFLIAGILAAAMSSVSSALAAMSSISIMDFVRPLFGTKGGERSELGASMIATWISGAVLGLIAWLCREAELILNLAFMLAGLTGGAILGAFLYGLIYKKGYPGPVIAGMITSFGFMIIYNLIRPYTGINWPWDATIGMLVCFVVIVLASIGLPAITDRDIRTMETDDS